MGDIIYTDKDRRDIFKEVREHDEFNDKLRTKVYTEEELVKLDIVSVNNYSVHIDNIEVNKYTDTIGALETCNDRYVAILNIADAFTPGGDVNDGGEGQECTLCRSTNLYESLIDNSCKDKFYTYNKKLGKASDRIIYTRNVTYFRDDNNDLWKSRGFIRQCDVITCTLNDELSRKMKYIINVADDNRVNTLIIGCGSDWSSYSELWFDVIRELKPNCKIIFATSGNNTRLELLFGKDIFRDEEDNRTEDDIVDYLLESGGYNR